MSGVIPLLLPFTLLPSLTHTRLTRPLEPFPSFPFTHRSIRSIDRVIDTSANVHTVLVQSLSVGSIVLSSVQSPSFGWLVLVNLRESS
mmetsp:Transcript_46495/g.91792  ORF Transcript_46495/g.91792 Transcript_46495/m.91792 type:complete len:88 (+) Transcript_46495:1300-1563(+)